MQAAISFQNSCDGTAQMVLSGEPSEHAAINAPSRAKISYEQPEALPETYAIRAVGDCLLPVIPSGIRLVCSSAEPYLPGDFVTIHQSPHAVRPGCPQMLTKQLVEAPKPGFWETSRTALEWLRLPTVEARSFNPVARHYWRPQDVLAIHKITGVVPDQRNTRPIPRGCVIPILDYINERTFAI